jgi:hypothetical protein
MTMPKDPKKVEEYLLKLSVAKKGKVMSDDFKKKRSEIMNKRWADPTFKQQMSEKHSGPNNPNYGKPMPDEQREKLRHAALNRPESWRKKQSESHTGHKDSIETKVKKSQVHAGKKCYNWKGGITPVYKHIRGHRRYKEWCLKVLKKYNHTDVFTGIRGGRLSCHHVIPVNTLIRMNNIKTIEDALECSLMWDINNGIVIKKSAHDKFHNLYGDDKNIYELTAEQIQELYQQ